MIGDFIFLTVSSRSKPCASIGGRSARAELWGVAYRIDFKRLLKLDAPSAFGSKCRTTQSRICLVVRFKMDLTDLVLHGMEVNVD